MSSEISASAVKQLRDRTGAGMMDCKRALSEVGGDIEKAVEKLRERGLAKASKRAGRATSEGLIGMALHGAAGALVELGCETDFVARTDEFQKLVDTLAAQVASDPKIDSVELLSAASIDGKPVSEWLTGAIATVGENVVLSRVARLAVEADGHVGGYVHAGGKLGVLVALFTGAYVARQQLGIEWSTQSIRDTVAASGVWGPLLFVALIAFRAVLMIPSQILLIAAGLCFGTVAGTLYGALGITLSGAIMFAVVRFMGREALLTRAPLHVQVALDGAGRRIGATFLVLATGYPVGPITAWHAGAGLTGMAFGTFVFAVSIGSLIRAATYTFFGSRFAEAGIGQVLLAGALLLGVAAVPLCFARSRRWVGQMLSPMTAVARAPAARFSPPRPDRTR
ncbi:MAG: translation elongation factor Ts [Deltaproteobacteria bacterium]|nr:MAG: translation elongation factor Ts [Deltaproteobacteria bacterium]